MQNTAVNDHAPPRGPGDGHVAALVCLRCGARYAPDEIDYVCSCRPNQGSDLGTLDVVYDYDGIRAATSPERIFDDRDRSIGRYAALLPIRSRRDLPRLAVGGTPLTHAGRLGESLGLTNLFVKDDGRNPSASLKARASAVAVARATVQGRRVIATASTGNAAAALSSQCAAAGLANVIFVPQDAPQAKIAQLLAHGSTVLVVEGDYDTAFDLCMVACAEFGWANRSTGINPYMTEGKKTVSFEIAQQLAELRGLAPSFQVPDALFVSVGDGCIIGGVHKGFADLLALGWIDRLPRLYGVQSTASAALHNAWRDNLDVPDPVQATSRADSICVNAPRDPIKALRAVRATGGAFLAVDDDAILGAILPLARLGAVFAEPAGAAALAGLASAIEMGLVREDETIVVVNTGSGLKDVAAAIQVAPDATIIAPTLVAVREALSGGPLVGT